MRKIETDTYWQSVDRASKDKQTLVLFILGSCLVIMPLLFSQSVPSEQAYSWVQDPERNTWQIVSTRRSEHVQESRLDQIEERQQSLQRLKTIPPELALFFNQPLSLQTCRQRDLEMLPGIGPRVASAIIATRQKKGRLVNAEDLLDVPGIGPSVLQRILPLISFE